MCLIDLYVWLGQVLKTTLSLYCDQNQPFPSMDEVVICTSETTTEEVSWDLLCTNPRSFKCINQLPALANVSTT